MYTVLKRILDILISMALLVFLAPLFLLIAMLVNVNTDGTLIFRQQRIGQYGQPFTIYKFRTMHTDAPHDLPSAQLRAAGQFITPIGRFLRQTGLDELPQLFNVLKGDMSFVGPRPVIPSEKRLLALRRRNGADTVRPGITGLAQIRGRDTLTHTVKALYDGEYAAHVSFLLDAYIVIITAGQLLIQSSSRRDRIEKP